MSRRLVFFGLLAAGGLFLYLWPALHAPVVLWSDSTIDLDWARQGAGIVSPASMPRHPAKPGYLLFLRGAEALGHARGIVIVQSVLVWVSIGATALRFGRIVGPGWGLSLYAGLILFLRLRDLTSAIMPEALTAAMALPIAVLILEPPRGRLAALALGFAVAALFLVRPNAGAAFLLLVIVSFLRAPRTRLLPILLASFLLLVMPVGILTSPSGDRLRGMSYALLVSSVDYAWVPSATANPSAADTHCPAPEELHRAIENWEAALGAHGLDARRARTWRALHGLLGTEFYDAGWSAFYRRLTTVSRVLSPFAILISVAVLLAAPVPGPGSLAKALGLSLLAAMVAQSLFLGALPRYGIPLIPAFFLFALGAMPSLLQSGTSIRIAAATLVGLLVLCAAWQRQVLDWEWGLVEKAGVRMVLRIPKKALPEREPATLHIRVAPPLLPSSAGLEVLGPSGERLYDSSADASREMPFISMPLPDSMLDANRKAAVDVTLVSTGDYGAYHYLLFPVIPPPWGNGAVREGTGELSPRSGIARGSLDWWAHDGAP